MSAPEMWRPIQESRVHGWELHSEHGRVEVVRAEQSHYLLFLYLLDATAPVWRMRVPEASREEYTVTYRTPQAAKAAARRLLPVLEDIRA